MSSNQQICILSIICLVPRNSHCEWLVCWTVQRSSWVILHLGVSRREREDNIILQALFDGIFFVGEKKVASLFLLYIADFFLMVNVHNTRIGLGTHTFSTHVCNKLTVRVRLKKNQSSQETHEDVCSPPLSVCYWISVSLYTQIF